MPIRNEKKILPNFASTQCNKTQVIAYNIGKPGFALVSKLDIHHECIEEPSKIGNVNDLFINKAKLLLILTSKGHVLTYDTSIGCHLLKCHALNTHLVKFINETPR